MEVFEIKRKFFEIEEKLGERSYRVSRKGKTYFLKDFEGDKKGFEIYIETERKLNNTGIPHPKIYAYDKNTFIVASEYIDGQTVLDDLINGELSEKHYELIFKANWFVKKGKLPIDFSPENWKLFNEKLFYLGPICGEFEEKKHFFENDSLRLWFYTKDFAKHLIKLGLPVNRNRVPDNEAAVNKQMALTVVKFYV